ncbi:MAG: helix-turn-helix domain-containing protein [Gemmataceae bacterium]
MRKKHLVRLTDAQRADPEGRFAGPLTLRQLNRVQVLLRADAGEADADIADDLGISAQTAANVRKRFAADGLTGLAAPLVAGPGPAWRAGAGCWAGETSSGAPVAGRRVGR